MTTATPHDGPVTRNEELVLAALRQAGAPQTAYQLLDTLRENGLKAPPQIYRALRTLGARHLVHRLDSLNAYVACAHHHGHDAKALVFMICARCGRVDEFAEPEVDRVLNGIASSRRFLVEDTAVEMRGVCTVCRENGDIKNSDHIVATA